MLRATGGHIYYKAEDIERCLLRQMDRLKDLENNKIAPEEVIDRAEAQMVSFKAIASVKISLITNSKASF